MRNDCKILAICSKEGESARVLAEHYQIDNVYSNYKNLLNDGDINIAIICTPNNTHYEIADYAIGKSKTILIEKPLCINNDDGISLINKAKKNNQTLYVASNNQFREENQAIKNKVLSGDLGNIELVDLEWYRTKRHASKTWLYNKQTSGGGVLIDLGTHLINFALSLFPRRTSYRLACFNINNNEFSTSVDDLSLCIIIIDNKIPIIIKTSWSINLHQSSLVNFRVFGSKGNVNNHDYAGERTDGYSAMLNDFFYCIEKESNMDLSIISDTMLIIDGLYQLNDETREIHSFPR